MVQFLLHASVEPGTLVVLGSAVDVLLELYWNLKIEIFLEH